MTGVPAGTVAKWTEAVSVTGLPCAALELNVAGVSASVGAGLGAL